MENRTVLVEQKIKNIQSDFGSVDYESVKKFHNQLIPKLIDNARAFGASNLPQNAEYEQLLISRYSALYTELIADETTMAEQIKPQRTLNAAAKHPSATVSIPSTGMPNIES